MTYATPYFEKQVGKPVIRAKESGMSLLISLILFCISSGWSMVTVQNVDCPVQFEGRVVEILEAPGPVSVFSTNKVVFSIDRSLKGEVSNQVLVDVLQNGPVSIERGEDYRVQLREGRICLIEHI